MANLMSVNRSFLNRILPAVNRRLVSTSKNNKTTVAADDACISKAKDVQHQNWITYGFDYGSKTGDRNAMHSIMFVSITLCMVVGGFVWAYAPDYNLRDWASREAFLELRRRERAGLPLIDPNLIDPAKIVLPSDEELGKTEIII